MMVRIGVCVLVCFFTACYAQLPLETPDFDVFAAIKNRSIDVSSYTNDTGDGVVTSIACSTAVSLFTSSFQRCHSSQHRANCWYLVHHTQDDIRCWQGFARRFERTSELHRRLLVGTADKCSTEVHILPSDRIRGIDVGALISLNAMSLCGEKRWSCGHGWRLELYRRYNSGLGKH